MSGLVKEGVIECVGPSCTPISNSVGPLILLSIIMYFKEGLLLMKLKTRECFTE